MGTKWEQLTSHNVTYHHICTHKSACFFFRFPEESLAFNSREPDQYFSVFLQCSRVFLMQPLRLMPLICVCRFRSSSSCLTSSFNLDRTLSSSSSVFRPHMYNLRRHAASVHLFNTSSSGPPKCICSASNWKSGFRIVQRKRVNKETHTASRMCPVQWRFMSF